MGQPFATVTVNDVTFTFEKATHKDYRNAYQYQGACEDPDCGLTWQMGRDWTEKYFSTRIGVCRNAVKKGGFDPQTWVENRGARLMQGWREAAIRAKEAERQRRARSASEDMLAALGAAVDYLQHGGTIYPKTTLARSMERAHHYATTGERMPLQS